MIRVAPACAALIALLVLSPVATAQDPENLPTRRSHAVSASYDVGRAHAFGLGWLYLHGFPPTVPFFWGAGVQGRLFTDTFSRLDGGAVSAIGRITIGHAPPFTFELGAGAVFSSEQVGGIAHAGVFFSLFYVDLGYSYQFPVLPTTRQEWMSSHQFSVRVQVPFWTD